MSSFTKIVGNIDPADILKTLNRDRSSLDELNDLSTDFDGDGVGGPGTDTTQVVQFPPKLFILR